MFPSRLAEPSQHATGLALKAHLSHVFAEWLHQQAVPRDLSLLSHSSPASTEPNTMGNKTPYALVPPAQTRLVLTLKGMHSGWALSQSTGYGELTKCQKKKTQPKNHTQQMKYTCVHQLATVHTMLPLCDSPHHPPNLRSCPSGYPSSQCKCFTPLLPHSHWLKGVTPKTQEAVCLSPTLWGLACSSISPAVSRRVHLAGLLPSSSCTAGKGAGSALAQAPPHNHPLPVWPKGRDRKRQVWRTEERAKRCHKVWTSATPVQEGLPGSNVRQAE